MNYTRTESDLDMESSLRPCRKCLCRLSGVAPPIQPVWISDKSPDILLQVRLGAASDSRSLVDAVLT